VTDVSRETDALRLRYRSAPGLQRYAEILATTGVQRGLIGPREVPRLWPRHLANCAVVAEEAREQVPLGSHAADLGAGAGLPGLVWALVREDLTVTLIEPLLRRATFLSEAVADLGLADRVHVLRERGEDVSEHYDVVTARAVARLPKLLGWGLPLVRPGGWFLAFKGAAAGAELDESRASLRKLGASDDRVLVFGGDVLAEPTTVVAVRKGGAR
jgi:16S rRNA (guanine527-N7)-methyltransferase